MPIVLVIEDEDMSRDLVLDALQNFGYMAIGAASGAEGIQMAKSYLPDLVLSDINMDNGDGYSVVTALRQSPETASMRIILMTGRASRVGMRQSMELGADDYLAKPFTFQELQGALQVQLKKKRLAEKEAQKKLEQIRTNIATSLPHELRTPLTAILGFSSIMATQSSTLERHEVTEIARTIHGSALRLQRLFENFLMFSHIELLETDPEEVKRLLHVTNQAAPLLGRTAQAKAQQYGRPGDLVLHLSHANVALSKDYLTKIAEEILDNAFKFSSPGTPVTVQSQVEHDTVVVTFQDRGQGMKPEEIPDLGAFNQFDRALHEQQGVGLGLTIAARLVRLHGGTFAIRSKPNFGTTIRIKLPLA